jgi:hypothetical protein
MRIIIAGGRDFDNYELLKDVCDEFLKDKVVTEIVTGKADGADYFGEKYAIERGFKVKEFPAEWGKYKKGAGHVRNAEMAEYSDCLIAFYDGKSKGTKNMLEEAYSRKLIIKFTLYKK